MALDAVAQSSEQDYPAPVTQSDISGTIRPRDIGDSRLTTHYWAFDGQPGDVFINVVTRNLAGDIDVYMADGLRPLTKMVVFADGTSETGRVIYLRQPGRMLLRVQGRTPNDDPATYTIKFAGSFVALAPGKLPKPPSVGDLSDSGVAVSSTGAILPQKPKPPVATPKPISGGSSTAAVPAKEQPKAAASEKKVTKPDSGVDTIFGGKNAKDVTAKPSVSEKSISSTKPEPKKDAAPDPMANVRLVVSFRDGHTVERPMSEIARFIYANGYLTVALKDGKTYRYAMTDLTSVNVQ